jgi:hypothetical protein
MTARVGMAGARAVFPRVAEPFAAEDDVVDERMDTFDEADPHARWRVTGNPFIDSAFASSAAMAGLSHQMTTNPLNWFPHLPIANPPIVSF